MEVFIAIGSNRGNRAENIQKAIDLLKDCQGVTLEKVSSIIETEPEGGPPQEKYLNAVVKIKTSHSARELLIILQAIESQLGRKRVIKDGPRTIDLDILLYGSSSLFNILISFSRIL